VTPAEVSRIEARVRGAYAEATATIAADDIAAHAPARKGSAADRFGRKRIARRVVPIVAALAVLLVVAAALVLPHVLAGPAKRHPAVHPSGAPVYMITNVAPEVLSVVDTRTGQVTARIRPPNSPFGFWLSVAAEGPLTFIAGDLGGRGGGSSQPEISLLYRIQLTSRGTVSSMRLTSRISGRLLGTTIAPGGTYLGYLLVGNRASIGWNWAKSPRLVIKNLVTGTVVADWPVAKKDVIGSLSLSHGGREFAATSYFYQAVGGQSVEDLSQRTVVLSPRTSDRGIDSLPALSQQAGPAVLSPNGDALYQIVATGRLTATSWHADYRQWFALEEIDTHTGAVMATLHRWSGLWRQFSPVLALDPTGRYLLIANGTSVAMVDLRTDRYTALPALPRRATGYFTRLLLPQGQAWIMWMAW
jgi:hypothetical protein